MKIKNYFPPKKDIWQGRSTIFTEEYFYQTIQLINIENCMQDFLACKGKKSVALIGFCCDAGVARNQGRVGAKQGPEAIRSQLAKLSWHFPNVQLYDFGDIICDDDNLENTQKDLAEVVAFTLKKGILPIVLGGGHETAWGNFQGIRKIYQKQNLHIINFDAHFDLRNIYSQQLSFRGGATRNPWMECTKQHMTDMDECCNKPENSSAQSISTDHKGSSGTPFLQIAQHAQHNELAFNYLVLGIQTAANTKALFDTARQLKVQYLTAEEIFQSSLKQQEKKIVDFLENSEGIYLTFCLDVMSAAIAPGVSAPQINGLFPQQVWPLLELIIKQKKVICFDVVELAPKFDQDFHTARLASRIIYAIIKDSFS